MDGRVRDRACASARLMHDYEGENVDIRNSVPASKASSSRRRRAQPPPSVSATDSDSDMPEAPSDEEVSLHEVSTGSDEEAQEGSGFAQYMDSDDEAADDGDQSSESDGEEDDEAGPGAKSLNGISQTGEDAIRRRMEHVPFATLLKARKAINNGVDDGHSDTDSEVDEFAAERSDSANRLREKEARELERRENKHAPTEVSSRKPVSRRRGVVDAPATQRRDPRFSSLSGSQVNAGVFERSYGFLREQQSTEVSELRKIHKQLRQQESHHAGPRAKSEIALNIRAERERVEQALRRQEGRESERQRRERETAVLRRKKKEIDDHVKQGGRRYFLKDADKKRLVLQDKFERLAGTTTADGRTASINGGTSKQRGALQRAVERKRKKNAARDRKMPLGGGSGIGVDSRDGMPPAAVPKRKHLAESSRGDYGSLASSIGPTTPSSRPLRKRSRRG